MPQVQRELRKLRRQRLVSYGDITDGTRITYRPDTWTDLDQMLESSAASYRRALWDNQPTRGAALQREGRDYRRGAASNG